MGKILVNVDVMMAKRKMSLTELAEKIDITPANLSVLKTGKAKAIRFSTLEKICEALECQPGDILEYLSDEIELNERILVTTLTKKMAEDLTEYLNENGIKVRYLHSDIDTLERVKIINALRVG